MCQVRESRAEESYEQGTSHSVARSRWSGFVLGDVAVGQSFTRATRESKLAVRLRPPAKWSYWKFFRNGSLAVTGLLIVCVRFVMGSVSTVAGLPIAIAGAVVVAAFLAVLFGIWRQNRLVYPWRLVEWKSCFCVAGAER